MTISAPSMVDFDSLSTREKLTFIQADLKKNMHLHEMLQHKVKLLGTHYFTTSDDTEKTKAELQATQVGN